MKYSNRVTTDRVSVIQDNCPFTTYIHWYAYPIVIRWEFVKLRKETMFFNIAKIILKISHDSHKKNRRTEGASFKDF